MVRIYSRKIDKTVKKCPFINQSFESLFFFLCKWLFLWKRAPSIAKFHCCLIILVRDVVIVEQQLDKNKKIAKRGSDETVQKEKKFWCLLFWFQKVENWNIVWTTSTLKN